MIDVMGPLGRGFSRGQACRNCNNSSGNAPAGTGNTGDIIVVGGGIGVAPLHFLLQEIAGSGESGRTTVLLGACSAGRLLIREAVEKMGFVVHVATDDGTAGHHGPVTGLLADALRRHPGFVYACGPAPMLKTVCALLAEAGVPGEVSVEERMACGVGACLSCACRVRDAGGRETYRRACVDGPVFPAGEVVW
jgi:dihydroorotate dehydrogenase electron transfer subunit